MPDSKKVTREWVGLAKKHAWFLARDTGEHFQLHRPPQARRRLGVNLS